MDILLSGWRVSIYDAYHLLISFLSFCLINLLNVVPYVSRMKSLKVIGPEKRFDGSVIG